MPFSQWWSQQRERNRRNVLHFSPLVMWFALIGSVGLCLSQLVRVVTAETAGDLVITLLAVVGGGALSLFWAVFIAWRRFWDDVGD